MKLKIDPFNTDWIKVPMLAGVTVILTLFAIMQHTTGNIRAIFVFSGILLFLVAVMMKSNVKISNLYYLMIFTLPLIRGLTIRVGAQWPVYVFLSYAVFFALLIKGGMQEQDNKVTIGCAVIMIISIAGTFVSHVTGIIPEMSALDRKHYVSPIILSLVENIRLAGCLIVVLLVNHFVRDFETFFKSLKIFCFSAFLESALLLYEFNVRMFHLPLPMVSEKATRQYSIRTFGTFYEPSQAGDYILIGIFSVLIMSSILTYYRKWKKGYNIVFLLMILALMSTFSFGAFVAGTIGVATILITSVLIRKNVVRSMVILFLILSVFSIGYFSSELVQKQIDYKLSRFYAKESEEETALNFNQRVGQLVTPEDNIIPRHSLFLGLGSGLISLTYDSGCPLLYRIPAEFGIIGLLAMFYLIWLALQGIYRMKRHPVLGPLRPIFLGVLISFFAFLPKYHTLNDAWLWFVIALLISSRVISKDDTGNPIKEA